MLRLVVFRQIFKGDFRKVCITLSKLRWTASMVRSCPQHLGQWGLPALAQQAAAQTKSGEEPPGGLHSGRALKWTCKPLKLTRMGTSEEESCQFQDSPASCSSLERSDPWDQKDKVQAWPSIGEGSRVGLPATNQHVLWTRHAYVS